MTPPAPRPAVSPVVIVGASLAGATTAMALRTREYAGRVILIGDEPNPPYERPLLSKGYLHGTRTFTHLQVVSESALRHADITLMLGRQVVDLRTTERVLTLNDGTRIPYGTLVLATGARARVPQIPGGHLPGFHVLRTLSDADALRRNVSSSSQVILMGMGLIGSEAAATLVTMGAQVTGVDPLRRPLHRAVPTVVGDALARRHASHGVRLRHERSITRIEGDGHVEAAVLSDGERVEADVILAAIGASPCTQLAHAGGLDVRDGIVTDQYGRSSIPGVYAVGDVVQQWVPHIRRHERVEHWRSAIQQAESVAATICGVPTPCDHAPWFWSDQYDIHLEVVGRPLSPHDELIVEGDLDHQYLVTSVRGGQVVGAVGVGHGRDIKALARQLPGGVTTHQQQVARASCSTLPSQDAPCS